MNMDHWCNDTDRGNLSTGRMTCHSATVSSLDRTRTDPSLRFVVGSTSYILIPRYRCAQQGYNVISLLFTNRWTTELL